MSTSRKSALRTLVERLQLCGGKEEYTILEHVKEMLNRIRANPEKYTLEKLEELSYLIKLTRLKLESPLPDHELGSLRPKESPQLLWISKTLGQLRLPPHDPGVPLGAVADILSESQMFEMAGVSVGEDWLLIDKAVKRLAIQTGSERVRFWGKLLCRDRDLFVIEMKANPEESYASVSGEDPRGKGLNENVYWVSDNLLGEWRKLPDVRAQDIFQARKIKKLITGNLDAPVSSYPFFTSPEQYFIRAQIARISASTVVVPSGIYKISETNPKEIEFAEDAVVPPFVDLKALDRWVHLNTNILKNGRSDHVAPPGIEDPEAYIEKEKEADPVLDRLRALNEDEKVNERDPWRFNVYGDEQQYAQLVKEGTTTYAVLALRPLKWPGAVTCFQNGHYQSIYVGYGTPRLVEAFEPLGPPQLLFEPEDPEDMPEPNPQKLPEVPAEPAEGEGEQPNE